MRSNIHPRGIAGGRVLRLLCAAALLAPGADGASADESVSTSFRLRGAGFSSGTVSRAASPGPRFQGSGYLLGRVAPAGPSHAAGSLTTLAPGLWPIVAGDLPTLDVDADGIVAFLDDDDDGDGLLDAVETATGTFVSAADTGSLPSVFDSDGDGFGDGDEVQAGSDPNDPESQPPPPQVPLLPGAAALLLFSLLGLTARGRARRAASR